MPKPRKKLGELLIEAGLIDEYQLRSALSHQQQWGGRLGTNLVKLGLIDEERLVAFLARHFRLPAIDFRRIRILPAVLQLIPAEVAKKRHVLPLFVGEEGGKSFLAVAMADPLDLEAIDELEFLTGKKIRPVVASDIALGDAIAHYYDQKGMPPYAPDAKPSSEMSYGDLIRITREYLRRRSDTEDTTGKLPASERTIDFEAEQRRPAPADEGLDEVIVFSGRKEVRLHLDEVEPTGRTASGRRGGKPDPEQVLKALVGLLIDKGVITKDELRRRLGK